MPGDDYAQKTLSLETENGTLWVRSFCTPEQIEKFSFREPLADGKSYRPLVARKENLIKTAALKDANVTLALLENEEIVGMGILEYPSLENRWHRVGKQSMMEVSILEVRRPWRGSGVAKKILHLTVDHPSAESRILYMVGYSWTWDLDWHEDSVMSYRNKLIRLFSGEGFTTFQTNEPNVMLRPENLFMARMGRDILKGTADRFKLVRFNLPTN